MEWHKRFVLDLYVLMRSLSYSEHIIYLIYQILQHFYFTIKSANFLYVKLYFNVLFYTQIYINVVACK